MIEYLREMVLGIGIYGEMTPGIGSSARYRMRERADSYTVESKKERKRKMEKDYVTYLQHSGEPEQEDCSTGIVPSECAETAKDMPSRRKHFQSLFNSGKRTNFSNMNYMPTDRSQRKHI